MGWTFKYPELDEITDEHKDDIVNCIEEFEDSLYNNHPLDSIADLHAFARWARNTPGEATCTCTAKALTRCTPKRPG